MTSALKVLTSEHDTHPLEVAVMVASRAHLTYVGQIIELIALSAQERGTGRGKRTVSEISQKIRSGQAVIALAPDKTLAGFCYVAAYADGAYFANSALVVAHAFRGCGLSRRIKLEAFQLGKKLFPEATPVTITTSAAVMKLNQELGYKAVSFSEITSDPLFWKGCQGCVNYDVLQRFNGKNCICTAMKCDLMQQSTVIALPTLSRSRRVKT